MIRLFVIDDHYHVADSLTIRMPAFGLSVIGSAEDVESTILKVERDEVDIFLLDLEIREKDPVNNITLLISNFPEIPVVILSQYQESVWQAKMIKKGAWGYFSKLDSPKKLAANLQCIHQNKTKIVPPGLDDLLIMNPDYPSIEKIPQGIEMIDLLAKGYGIKEIGKITGQSRSNVEKKLIKIRSLYNLRTNFQIVYEFFYRKPIKN